MKISFLTPGYVWGPSGGIRVVYEYANLLVARGHEVAVVHPLKLTFPPPSGHTGIYRWLRSKARDVRIRMRKRPVINWHPIDNRVKMLWVPDSSDRNVPDGDAVFATGWTTVRSIQELAPTKGAKCYMIQGYESYHAPKDLVDATWRAPLHKVVIAKWLVGLGKELGASDLTYIPNGVDHSRYKLKQPIEGRTRRISMLYSAIPIKGAADGLEALGIVRNRYPDIKVVLFGVAGRPADLPDWVEYHSDPPQDYLIDEIYNKSMIYLAPSWIEGSSLPPVEAACCGCAIVATDIGGFSEHIDNEVSGLLSPIKDPAGLAKNILRLLDDDSMRVRMAHRAKGAVSNLTWDRSVDLMEDFLSGVVQGKKNSAELVTT
jgi:glycosyltransferase involved in cell wall biosynthesis